MLTNLYVNYRIERPMALVKRANLQFSIDNLFDRHNIVAIAAPLSGSSDANPLPNDLLSILPGRSLSLSLTADF